MRCPYCASEIPQAAIVCPQCGREAKQYRGQHRHHGQKRERPVIDRVLEDIRDARDHGARTIFLVDDNITLNVRRFEALCQALIETRLHQLDYIVQAMTSAIANHNDTLVPLMRRAGFRYVFLGIENILEADLNFLRAASKNVQRENGRKTGNATLKAIAALHRNKMYVVGGLIVGKVRSEKKTVGYNAATQEIEDLLGFCAF